MSERRDVWFENALLFVLAGVLGYFYLTGPTTDAFAAGGGWDTNGVMAMTTTPNERLILIDTNKKNICIYKVRQPGEFRLVGARSYKYDTDMKDTAGSLIEKGNGATYMDVKFEVDKARTQEGR